MFSHSGTWDAGTGPLVEVGLFSGPPGWQSPQEIPRFRALIDTGAEETCVSRTATASLGIRDNPIGLRSVVSPSGRARLNVYEIHLVFFITSTVTQILEMEVAETKTDSHDWDVLLGRDVLSRAMFTMDFGGRFAVGIVR